MARVSVRAFRHHAQHDAGGSHGEPEPYAERIALEAELGVHLSALLAEINELANAYKANSAVDLPREFLDAVVTSAMKHLGEEREEADESRRADTHITALKAALAENVVCVPGDSMCL